MTLVQSAKLNGHDPQAYLKDGLDRLPTQPNSRIDELMPHSWKPQAVETDSADAETVTSERTAA